MNCVLIGRAMFLNEEQFKRRAVINYITIDIKNGSDSMHMPVFFFNQTKQNEFALKQF